MARRRVRFPELSGRPIEVSLLKAPHAWRGRLLAGAGRGVPVHAGCFIRERRVVLDLGLLRFRRRLERILLHELYHFAWVRLGNRRRRDFERLLREEWNSQVAGELGWSAQSRKNSLKRTDAGRRTRRWREYACESFCDTAAWLLAGRRGDPEATLPAEGQRARRRWFMESGLLTRISV